MGNEAHGAGLLGEHARSQRTGLVRRTPEEMTEPLRSGAARGELMRLFVAIAPPAAVLDELDSLAGPLRPGREDLRWTNREAWHVTLARPPGWSSAGPPGREDLRWTNREAWHVTLAFLGQVDESAATRLLHRLENAARRHHVFRLAFAGAGAFPTPARANVLWSGISGDRGALAHLAESVAAGASRAGAPPPDRGRRFRPHLTLARCRMPADVTGLVAALDGYQGPSWPADRIHLVRSRLGATEYPRFTTLGSWPLRRDDHGRAACGGLGPDLGS